MIKTFVTKKSLKPLGLIVAVLALALSVTVVSTQSAHAADFTNSISGTEGTVEVPEGAIGVDFVIVGGSGESGDGTCGGDGGVGAKMTGTLAVDDGDLLVFLIGAHGADSEFSGRGGSNGGGNGGDATILSLNGYYFENVVAVAAGGGGGGASYGYLGSCEPVIGGSGGTASTNISFAYGTDGNNGEGSVPGGTPGTTEGPGEGGVSGELGGSDGSGGSGGDGGNQNGEDMAGGGGGGSGYFGGGGGSGGYIAGAGGGAGANFAHEDLVSDVSISNVGIGMPRVEFTWIYGETETTSAPTTTAPTTTAPTSEIPNGGDANNDGTVDADQDNVATFVNSANSQWTSVEASSGCFAEGTGAKKEVQLPQQDGAYDYPAGLIEFELGCLTNGQTVTISQYFYGITQPLDTLVARKFTPYNEQFQNLTGSSVEELTIDGQRVVKVTYSLTDGGPLDDDQSANGTIVDPAGLALAPGNLPATGANNVELQLGAASALLIAGAALATGRTRKKSKAC